MSKETGSVTPGCPESHHCLNKALLQFSFTRRSSKDSSNELPEAISADLPEGDAGILTESEQDASGKSTENVTVAEATVGQKLKLVHITKTGGTALEAWGRDHGFSWGFLWKEAGEEKYGSPLRDAWHTPPMDFLVNPYAKYEMFVVVRDPYARMISEFRCPWWGYGGMWGPGPGWKDNGGSVMQWNETKRAEATADDLNAWLQEKLRDGAARPPFHYGHFIPQYLYIFDQNGKRLIQKENVLRAEHLGEDFETFRKRHNVTGDSLKRINDSDMKTFKVSDLTEGTRKLIEEEYSEDFKRFGYPKYSEG